MCVCDAQISLDPGLAVKSVALKLETSSASAGDTVYKELVPFRVTSESAFRHSICS